MKQKLYNKLKFFTSKQEFSTIIILLLMLVGMSLLQNGFFTRRVIVSNINAFLPLILLSMGQAIVIVSGGLDMSCGNAMALMLCAMTKIMKADSPYTGVIAILVCILLSLAVGLANGFLVGYLRLPAIIATYATSYIWLGLALFITPTPGGEIVNWFKIFYDFSAVKGCAQWIKTIGSVLAPSVIMILLACTIWFFIGKKKLGRYIHAVGSHDDNAYYSGISTTKVHIKAYVINSLFIMMAALYFAGQNGAGSANIGETLTLQTVAAAVVGGVALSGGKGNVFMAIVGAIIMSLVSKIIYYINVPSAWQSFVSGVIIIIAISASAIYSYAEKRNLLREVN